MKVSLLYFAQLAEQLNCSRETLEFDTNDLSLAQLIETLAQRGEPWQSVLNHPSTRCAVAQKLAQHNDPVRDGDEIAFFPPVTGG